MKTLLINLVLLNWCFAGVISTAFGAEESPTWRKATLEVRQGDEGAVFTMTTEGPDTYLKMDSLTESWKYRLSSPDADYLRSMFNALPVVPTLPPECRRDFARAEFSPSDQRPRATCLSQKTKYSPKYADLVKALGFARLKYAAENTNKSLPAPNKEPKSENMRR